MKQDMDAPAETGYQPPQGFMEDKRDSLIDINLTDSTELWLIQWPINQQPDFDMQQVSLDLDKDGHIGTFEGSSGKTYEVVSYKSQGPEAMVFLSSASETKIAGKISRHMSLIHYPEPSELQKRNTLNSSHSQRSSTAASTLSGRSRATPSRSSRPDSGYSTPSGRTKSIISGSVGHSNPSKRKRDEEQSRSVDHSVRSSGKGNSVVTSTGSKEHSEERKSKKKKSK